MAGSGGLNAAGHDIAGFDAVVVSGSSANARNLDAKSLAVSGGSVNLSGGLSVDQADVSGSLNVAGSITPRLGTSPGTARTIRAGSFAIGGGLNYKGTDAGLLLGTPGAGHTLAFTSSGNVDFDASGINGANFDGGDSGLTSLAEGGDGGTLHVGTDAAPVGGNVTVNNAITATTGTNGTGVLTGGGKGGAVSVVSSGSIDVNNTVKVSDSAIGRASKQGGNIRLESRKTAGTAITVSNSGQLLALLSSASAGPGGKIQFVSAGGEIAVKGGTIAADRGTVDLRNVGAGNIVLTNANLRGDVVKANVFGANGQLIIGGGSLDADSAIKLYASGANGTVLFKDNVSLNGTSAKTIAGNTVTINDGKVVTVNGPSAANVFTNNPNYTGSGGNGSTTGKFGGRGATTQPFTNRPAY